MNLEEIRKEFRTKEEEIAFLRSLIAEKEGKREGLFVSKEDDIEKKNQINEILLKYKRTPAEQVLSPEMRLDENHLSTLALGLSPEVHDDKIQKLIEIFMSEGVKNAFSVLERMNDQHLNDDFHRFLVQYISKYNDKKNFGSYKETFIAVSATLFQIVLPTEKSLSPDQKESQNVSHIVALMERFYTGMLAISDPKNPDKNKNYFSVEVAKPTGGNQIHFYVSVPNDFSELFQKQLLALYPTALIKKEVDDYNIFVENGYSVGAYAKPGKLAAMPIKTYKDFTSDTISVALSVLTKLDVNEGAAIQIVIRPMGEKYIQEYGKLLDKFREGKKSLRKAMAEQTTWGNLKYEFKNIISGESKKEHSKNFEDTEAERMISEKLNSTIFATNLRLLASSNSSIRSSQILHEVASSFRQYTETKGNSITFEGVKAKNTHVFFKHYTYRFFDDAENFPLNAAELATIYHFPKGISDRDFAELKQYDSVTAPAPQDLPKDGIYLGKNIYRHKETPVYFQTESRVRHMYVIGQTGTGKSKFLQNMIIQDIKNGEGLCFIDPHGADLQDILTHIPKERIDDVIYFDPADLSRPMGLNMLEYDVNHPEQKTLIVNELLMIFNKLFDMKTAGGPAFEQYFRNSALLVMEHPESGNTLLEISRVLSDAEFRHMKLSKCQNPLVKQFFQNAEATSGEQGFENYVPYVTNKFDNFLSNEFMRPIISQEKSAFDIREVMDNKKILLVNLSKGKLGEMGSFLIGLIIVGKILISALARDPSKNPPPFYLYLDEFQNVATDSIQQILSEARKYKLGLVVAHQFIKQLPENIRNAVFGNVGSMAIFRIEPEDAKFIENYFSPTFAAKDIIGQTVGNCYVKLLANNSPQKPFNLYTPLQPKGDENIREVVKELSGLKYGSLKDEVDEMIMKKMGV